MRAGGGARPSLLAAAATDDHFREYLQTDEDFVAIRNDPRLPR